MDEQEIISRSQQGELELLDSLVRMHEDSLYRFSYHLCGNADSAAELFQDTWLKALKNIGKYNASGTFLGWLFTIAANLRRDNYRRSRRWKIIQARQLHHPLPAEEMELHELQFIIHEALEPLDESLRIPVTLFYFEDYSLQAIADLLDIPVGTVKSRLHRAKKHLRNQLEVLL